ncbi:DUF29 domain-containing protein [Merismopedia glauca]|uniref:DUF29 domain-containing protein n=2 Tax=Merismopedia TaxID=53402 RepID=A0A2T1CAC7_9CYAN|nr:DUF29 domain-containing protein [Merismopedia glauca CCAP 1448/3]
MFSKLYQQDFSLWAQQTAELLRQRRFEEIDLEILAQEVEDLGKSERRAIASYLTVLLTHLLKWQYQASGRQYTIEGEPKGSWAGSITYSRLEIQKLLADNPSLLIYPKTVLAKSYQDAVKVAIKETGLKDFPIDCPFTIDQALDDNWFPDGSK